MSPTPTDKQPSSVASASESASASASASDDDTYDIYTYKELEQEEAALQHFKRSLLDLRGAKLASLTANSYLTPSEKDTERSNVEREYTAALRGADATHSLILSAKADCEEGEDTLFDIFTEAFHADPDSVATKFARDNRPSRKAQLVLLDAFAESDKEQAEILTAKYGSKRWLSTRELLDEISERVAASGIAVVGTPQVSGCGSAALRSCGSAGSLVQLQSLAVC